MSTETLLVILLVWIVTGFFVAMAFGRAIQKPDTAPDDEILASSTGSIKYIRRNKHRSPTTRSNENTDCVSESVSNRVTV